MSKYRRALSTAAVALVAASCGLFAPSATADTAVNLCEVLTPTIAFDQPSYQPGATATLKVTLTNTGDETLTGIITGGAGGAPTELVWDNEDWGGLASSGPGVTLGAGQTTVIDGSGVVPSTAADYGYVNVLAPFLLKDDSSTCDPATNAQAKVPGKFGDVTGRAVNTVNGRGVAGAYLGLYTSDEASACIAVTKSDANGRFLVPHVPTGNYTAAFVPPPGFTATNGYSDDVTVGPGNKPLKFTLKPGHDPNPYQPPFGCPGSGGATTTTTTSPAAGGSSSTPAPQGSAGPELANTGVAPAGAVAAGLGLLVLGGAALAVARRRANA